MLASKGAGAGLTDADGQYEHYYTKRCGEHIYVGFGRCFEYQTQSTNQ